MVPRVSLPEVLVVLMGDFLVAGGGGRGLQRLTVLGRLADHGVEFRRRIQAGRLVCLRCIRKLRVRLLVEFQQIGRSREGSFDVGLRRQVCGGNRACV
jgi:hypothetical protein